DVGANIGQFAIASSMFYPKTQIISFEPVQESFSLLKKNTENKKNITTYGCALGDEKGTLTFYHNQHSHASSALAISDFQTAQIPQTQQFNKIEVPVRRLDEFEAQIIPPALLKLDVQGYEKKVLEGGLRFLQKVDYLLFETSFVRMYDEEPLFEEMHEFVTRLGFTIVAPVGTLKANNQIVQLDMLYKRK
ncbi:MAG: FkbM family methyltransferase, partial [Bacteroidota bacterium]